MQHHLAEDEQVAEAQEWLKRRGWKSLFAAAVPGKKAATSSKSTQGGVAILARDWLGLNYFGKGSKEAKTVVVYPGRVAGAKVILPGGRSIAVYSVYMRVGEKLSLVNRAILAKLAEHVQSHDWEWLIGGDFNMHPRELEAAAFTTGIGGLIKAPTSATCMMGTASTIDYFIVSSGLGNAPTQESSTQCEAIRPHMEVALRFTVPLAQVKVLKYQWAPVLPRDMPFGPQLPPEEWAEIRAKTQEKLEALRSRLSEARAGSQHTSPKNPPSQAAQEAFGETAGPLHPSKPYAEKQANATCTILSPKEGQVAHCNKIVEH